MALLAQAPVDGPPQPLLHGVDVVVVHYQVATQILDLPAVLRDDLGLVGLQADGLHAPEGPLVVLGARRHGPVGLMAVVLAHLVVNCCCQLSSQSFSSRFKLEDCWSGVR